MFRTIRIVEDALPFFKSLRIPLRRRDQLYSFGSVQRNDLYKLRDRECNCDLDRDNHVPLFDNYGKRATTTDQFLLGHAGFDMDERKGNRCSVCTHVGAQISFTILICPGETD